MKHKLLKMLGVCYVTFAIVAASSTFSTLDKPLLEERSTDKLVQKDNRGDRDSERLSRTTGVPTGDQGGDRCEGFYHGWLGRTEISTGRKTAQVAGATAVADYEPNCLIFWTASGCGSCTDMCSTIKQLKSEGYTIYEFNYDSEPELADDMGIKSFPTSVIHFRSREVKRYVGTVSATTIKRYLRRNRSIFQTTQAIEDYKPNCLIFWTASWCPACKDMYPTIERLKREGYTIYVLDYDENQALGVASGIEALPTSIIHTNSIEVRRYVGKTSAATLKRYLKKNRGIDYEL